MCIVFLKENIQAVTGSLHHNARKTKLWTVGGTLKEESASHTSGSCRSSMRKDWARALRTALNDQPSMGGGVRTALNPPPLDCALPAKSMIRLVYKARMHRGQRGMSVTLIWPCGVRKTPSVRMPFLTSLGQQNDLSLISRTLDFTVLVKTVECLRRMPNSWSPFKAVPH